MNDYCILVAEQSLLSAKQTREHLLRRGYQVAGVADSYQEAVRLYLREQPDLVLIDVHIDTPFAGFRLARFIRSQARPSPFIYLDAGFESGTIQMAKATFPVGYLTKPLSEKTLWATIEISLHRHLAGRKPEPTISIFEKGTTHRLPVDNILYLRADHIYVSVFTAKGNPLVERGSLSGMLERLPPQIFIRTHRSFAVNKREVSQWDQQYVYVRGEPIPVSRSRRKEVFQMLDRRESRSH